MLSRNPNIQTNNLLEMEIISKISFFMLLQIVMRIHQDQK